METQAYNTLMKLAAELRGPDQSQAQAFAKAVATPEGMRLFKQHQDQQLGDSQSYVTPTVTVEKSAPANVWSSLVAAVQRIEKCSLSKAIDTCLASPEGREVYDLHTRNEMIKSGAYTPADMTYFDSAKEVRAYNGCRAPGPVGREVWR
jgi:hypothetical protein